MTTGAEALKHLDTPFVDTRRAERLAISIASLDDLARDIDRIEAASHPGAEGLRVTGNWSVGRVFDHLARTIERSMDGFATVQEGDRPLPTGLARFVSRAKRSRTASDQAMLKSRLLTGPMAPAGPSVAIPIAGDIEPSAQVWTPDGAARLRVALARIRDGHPMEKPSPTLGPMTHADWIRFHVLHAELHVSFVLLGSWR